MEVLESEELAEIERVKSEVENILQNKLGDIEGTVKRFKGRISTSPLRTDLKLAPKDFYGKCGDFSNDIKDNSEEVKFSKYTSANPDTSGHQYLGTDGTNGTEVIVDAAIGEFLEGHNHTFVGTRTQLKDLFLNQTGEGKPYKIVNTRSRNNPQEAFLRIYGDASRLSGEFPSNHD